MLGELVGEVVGWVIGEILGEAVFEAVLQGLRWLVPKRITGFGVALWWLSSFGAGWCAVDWWSADPTSNVRTGITLLACLLLTASGIMLTLAYDSAVHEPRRPAPASRITVSPARPRRW